MKIKLLKKALSVLCAISISAAGCIGVEAVKTRLDATAEMAEPIDSCNTQLNFIKSVICDSSIKSHSEKNLESSSKLKDLIWQIEWTLKPLENLCVNDVDEANSLKNALRRLYEEILTLKNYIDQEETSEEELIKHIHTVVIKGAAVSFVKTRILINAAALSM